MGKLKNLSIKKTFCLIVIMTVIAVILVSTASVRLCSNIRDQILFSHAFILQPSIVLPEENGSYTLEAGSDIANNEVSEFTDREIIIFKTAQTLSVLLPVIFSFAGIACASSLFYRIKLKEPLDALKHGIVHIADNDLSFSMSYQKQDELGQICGAFETMRLELLNNNRRMWGMLDERKKINASISHDLRTPITVIKGYSEYLDRNIGKNVLTEDGMRDILSEQHQTKINISERLPEQTAFIAPSAVFRIVENIVSNSLRYCKSKIDLDFSYSEPFLTITVTDDGKGFSEQDRTEAVNYFYKGKKEKEHFGIGLTICKILAEKHGGMISLDNAPDGGAKVTVKLNIG